MCVKTKEIHIAFGSNDAYSKYLYCCIASILETANEGTYFHFYIVDNGISETNKAYLQSLSNSQCDIGILVPNIAKIDGLPHCCHLGLSAYLRLLLPELLPDVPKCIYLDCDIIVNSSLDGLWDFDLQGFSLGAVEDVGDYCKNHPRLLAKQLNLTKYFNSGVLLLDLDKLRSNQKFNESLKYLEENADKVSWADQDALNVVFENDRAELPINWNIQIVFNELVSNKDFKNAIKNLNGIVHYIGPYKPDHFLFVEPSKKLYLKYAQDSPWGNDIIKPRSISDWKCYIKNHIIRFLRRIKWSLLS